MKMSGNSIVQFNLLLKRKGMTAPSSEIHLHLASWSSHFDHQLKDQGRPDCPHHGGHTDDRPSLVEGVCLISSKNEIKPMIDLDRPN